MHGEIQKVVVTSVVMRLFLFCQVRQELARTFVIQLLFLGLYSSTQYVPPHSPNCLTRVLLAVTPFLDKEVAILIIAKRLQYRRR